MESVLIRSCSPPLLTEAGDLCDLRSSSSAKRAAAAMSQRFAPVVTCSSRSDACIPKLELFSRSKLERWPPKNPLDPKKSIRAKKNGVSGPKLSNAGNGMEKHCPMPDGLPKSLEELEEEEMGRLPDSPDTRFAQKQGKISLLGIRLPRCREGIAKERDLDASPRPLRSLPSTLSLSVLPPRRAPTPCGRRSGRLEVSIPIGVDNRRLGLVRRRLVPMGRERMLKDNISAKIQKEKRKKESRVSGFCWKTASGG